MKQIRFSIEALYGCLGHLPPPLVFLCCAVGMVLPGGANGPDNLFWSLLVVCLAVVGALIALWALLGLKLRHTTVDPIHPELSSVLVTTGAYRIGRNPMYLSLLIWLMAWGSWLQGGWWGGFLFWLWIDRVQIPREERALTTRFGSHYREYCRRVRRWC